MLKFLNLQYSLEVYPSVKVFRIMKYPVSLPGSSVGLSVICHCGISWLFSLFSSPKPKAQGELIVLDSSGRPSDRASTLSNINISETS